MEWLRAGYTLMNALLMIRLDRLGFAAIVAPLLSLVHGGAAQGGSSSCTEKVSAYVAELDQLLSKEREWITPYDDLNARYTPFLDRDGDAFLEEVVKSRFIKPIAYNPRSKGFVIHFSNDDVQVGFVYEVEERRSDYYSAKFVRK
ncbi:hypothetical protein V1277_000902 [Bradyrhizobium sp. AZCC 1588]|uniref:hypothetical protein n=1 Tax=unclassified Bradyrhizobium TaxID=2631580 RepID=UPI002FF1532D